MVVLCVRIVQNYATNEFIFLDTLLLYEETLSDLGSAAAGV